VAKILIVDDDPTTIKLLQMFLELDGFDVTTAPRGADVLPTAHASPPDLILMDYHLSDMDGVTVLRQLRALPAFERTPIVMASGMDVEEEAIGAGATSFLIKPFDPTELGRLFKKLIDG
jgi:two-component system chemotaxis response regulator CheY